MIRLVATITWAAVLAGTTGSVVYSMWMDLAARLAAITLI